MPDKEDEAKKIDLGHLRIQRAGRIQIPKDTLEDSDIVGGDSARVILDDIHRLGRRENPGKKGAKKK